MSIVIFGDLFTYPHGSAATNRVHTYANGFFESGLGVHVICFTNDYLENGNGDLDGVKFYHPFSQKNRSRYFLIRRWQTILKYFRTYTLISRINKDDKILVINSWSNRLFTHLFGCFLAKLSNSKFIVECSEHPLRHFSGRRFQMKVGTIKFYIEAAISNGIFCISQYLVDYYKSKGIQDRKLFLVPSTVDPRRFTIPEEKPVDYNYIGYFGSLTFVRDNIGLLIEAFSIFSSKNNSAHLILGGFCSIDEKRKIEHSIIELNLQSKIHLLGYLKREEVIKYILHANILVMVRSNDLQSQASYPSKLTEYLASARPVVTLNVGEISLYLTDGLNAFLVEPGDAAGLAKKLDFVWNNIESAEIVGLRGKELTNIVFNYKYQAERMISFINLLNKKAT